MRTQCLFPVLFLPVFALSVAAAADPQTRWLEARQIQYKITGEYDGRFLLDATGDAHATDRVEIEFTTNADGDLQGDVTIRNFKSEVADLQPLPVGCRKPELHGEVEFYTLKSFQCMACNESIAAYADPEESGAASKNMTMSAAESERTFPDMVVGASCAGKRSVAAHTDSDGEMVSIPGRGEFMMDPSLLNSAERKLDPATGAIIEQKSGWTWTYLATPIGG